jgi:hypothetical protein
MILRRIPGERFSEVLPAWSGQVAVVIGGGASLTREQVKAVEVNHAQSQCRAIAVNDAYLWAPWADVCYFADSHWWRWHTEGVAKPALGLTAADVRDRFARFGGQKCSIQNSGANVADEAVHIVRNRTFPAHGIGLSDDPRALITGRNSGFQGMNLAILAGAATVILLGFDGRPAPDGREHFHGGHPRRTPAEAYPLYVDAMVAAHAAIAARGVRVINATPGSAIDCFDRMPLSVALEEAFA